MKSFQTLLIGLRRTMATFYGDNCWENGIVDRGMWHYFKFEWLRVIWEVCAMGKWKQTWLRPTIATGAGLVSSAYQSRAARRKSRAWMTPSCDLIIRGNSNHSLWVISGCRDRFKAATLIKIHSLNKIYSLC